MVLGDSKVIIDWVHNTRQLQSLVLSRWIGRTRKLIDSFAPLPFRHIYREYNSQANKLSKSGLSMELGVLFWKELHSGRMIEEGVLQGL